ncbi:DUF454 domain-containing protein [Vibrio sp. SM6]|uniref:Inner membrane protein n=1 Tax=Vibrio agarilyticus TaxID=2726741 RepID=A0A7X8TU35_9VIBR|nr:YbaN family protein [Vibrio agarilyticus]NLS14537.1 DUF454 domain-containing protein [Vibrio agarilyticus]
MESTITKITMWLFNLAGGLCLFLGLLGLFLPLLPTTPFILLASACWFKGSPRFHIWLHQHKTFGPILMDWQQHRAVAPNVKRKGTVMIVASFAFSIWWVNALWLKLMLLALAACLLSWFLRLPEIEQQ